MFHNSRILQYFSQILVSRATLDQVEEWFGFDDAVGRFRPNIVIEGVDAFWEDLLVCEDHTQGTRVNLGSTVSLASLAPVHRCVVPSRSSSISSTPGDIYSDWFKQFQERRKASYPIGAPLKRLSESREVGREGRQN